MTLLKKITLILLCISIHFTQLNAQDLIENTRAGIDPGLIDSINTFTTLIFDNIDEHWSADEATVMDVFNTKQASTSIANELNSYLNDYVLLNLIPSELENIYTQQPTNVLMIIPVTEDYSIELALIKSDDIAVEEYTSTCLHYKGVVAGASGSMAALTFTNNQISLMINDANGNYLLNKMKDTENSYILYNDRILNSRASLSCGEIIETSDLAKLQNNAVYSETRDSGDKCVSVYFECDYNTFLTYNSSVEEVIFKIEATFNQVQLIYAEESITLRISDIDVFIEPDPEIDDTIATTLLKQKASRLKNVFPGNLAHFVTTKEVGDGGLAYVGEIHSLSSLNAGGDQRPFPDYSRDVYLVAHEIGHNLGSQHTQTCVWGPNGNEALDNCAEPAGECNFGPEPENGGTIMSYCITQPHIGVNFVNGFGTEPGAVIKQGAENYNCQKGGCTLQDACNYNPFAKVDDGSCVTGYDVEFFKDYPIIEDIINNENCLLSGAILYNNAGIDYIYIIKPSGNVLLPSTLDWECGDTPKFNCRKAYNLSDAHLVKSTCACECEPEVCNTNPCLEGGVQNWNAVSCSCEIVEPTNLGCGDPNACNFDPLVNCPDNSICLYEPDCAECIDTGTFFFDDCSGENYYFIQSEDGSIFDPYLTEEDYSRLFGNGAVQEIEVKFDYLQNDIGNPCNIQTVDITCIEPIADCNKNIGTFFFDDCSGENYYFIRLEDGSIFDPYLTEEDYNRLFGNGAVQEIEVKFDYVLKDTSNPCDIQPIDIICVELVEQNTCNDGILNGEEEEIDCGGDICEPCIPGIFIDYPELFDLVDPSNCNGETVMVFDLIDYVYIFVGIDTVGALYYGGNPFCEDVPGFSCLSSCQLNKDNATAVWTCGEIEDNQNKASQFINQNIDAPLFDIYPNPSNGQVFIEFDTLNSSNSIINVYEVSGRKVFTKSLGDDANEKKIELNLNELNKGIYFVEIVFKQFKQTQKLLIN